MTEKDSNDYCANTYDYSKLNSRYEANIERNEIIEWNKDADNARYHGLKRIAEKLNFKQMQLENCRKGYETLVYENKKLKEELQSIYALATINKAIQIINTIYDDYLNKDPNNRLFDAKREILIECLEKLDNFKDTLE